MSGLTQFLRMLHLLLNVHILVSTCPKILLVFSGAFLLIYPSMLTYYSDL